MLTLILHDNKRGVEKAVIILKKGGLLVYPTETAYGIACDATSRKAVKKVYKIKKRSFKKPLSVIFGSLKQVKNYVCIDKPAIRLIRTFMPGPLTLVAAPKKRLVGSPKNEIAFRIPSGSFALKLAKKFKKPVTATSANISGEKPIYAFEDAFSLFNGKADAIVIGGNLPGKKVSTIFSLIGMQIIRRGAISGNKIKKCLLRNRAK